MSPTTLTKPVGAGRPRDGRIDDAVPAAVLQLLEEVGYARLSIAAVAVRAGTSKPAVYRRWPTKAHLVHEAVFPTGVEPLVPDGPDFIVDLRSMLTATVASYGRPAARAAIPGLLSEFAADPTLQPALRRRLGEVVWGRMTARVDRAVDEGDLRADVDAADLIEVVSGLALAAVLMRPVDELDDAWVDTTLALITRGICP